MVGLIMSETQQLTTGNKTWHLDDEVTRKELKKKWRIFFVFRNILYFIHWSQINIYLKFYFIICDQVIEGRNCLALVENVIIVVCF